MQTMRTVSGLENPLGSGPLGGQGLTVAPPLHTNVNVAAVEGVKEALDQRGPLQGEGGHEEGKTHAAEAIALQEDHKKAKTYEDHGVHILKACGCTGEGQEGGRVRVTNPAPVTSTSQHRPSQCLAPLVRTALKQHHACKIPPHPTPEQLEQRPSLEQQG